MDIRQQVELRAINEVLIKTARFDGERCQPNACFEGRGFVVRKRFTRFGRGEQGSQRTAGAGRNIVANTAQSFRFGGSIPEAHAIRHFAPAEREAKAERHKVGNGIDQLRQRT